MRTQEQVAADYRTYRGKCKEMSEAAVANDPTLRLVRGHVFVVQWNSTEAHWWCERADGTIFDPSVLQFPSAPHSSLYEEFDGRIECCNCGKEGTEDEFVSLGAGDYMACSVRCARSFVGV